HVADIHLAVAVYFDNNLSDQLQRLAKSGHHSASYPLIDLMIQQEDPVISGGDLGHNGAGLVRAGIVHDNDPLDENRHGSQNGFDFLFHSIGGHDRDNEIALKPFGEGSFIRQGESVAHLDTLKSDFLAGLIALDLL